MDSVQQRKELKKQNLVNAAYELFMSKGFNKTSIDEIVMKAKVAKGTFYLYFKDKNEVMKEIVVRISRNILLEAFEKVKANDRGDFVQNVLFFVDNIIEYFKRNKLVLRLIERNFSWPLVKEQMGQIPEDSAFQEMADTLTSNMEGRSQEEVFKLIYVIVATCGSVCYSSIIYGEPDTIDNMKPTLYHIIEQALTK
ncbi:TetR/AcrR family transcriptional regulator [Gehongia tenuis]|uniref:TetR/AcrR family transcriptional regulator n=1 Tax=Gehongia tenuis TaxID=2763655 RepID=UPI002015F0EE|nr:TetR/AcrR family transcriptional regulator [Gehongia tenuis]